MKLGGGTRMCKKPSQKGGIIFGSGSNSYLLKIYPIMSLTKKSHESCCSGNEERGGERDGGDMD